MTLLRQRLPHSYERRSSRPLARRDRRPGRLGQDGACRALCKRLRDNYDIYLITKDIYTTKSGEGVEQIATFVIEKGGLAQAAA